MLYLKHKDVFPLLSAIAAVLLGYSSVGGQIVRSRTGESAWLGLSVRNLNRIEAAELRLPEGVGVVVDFVIPNSPAETADLRRNDVVLLMAGQPIESSDHLSESSKKLKVGRTVELSVLRDREEIVVELEPTRSPTRERIRQLVVAAADGGDINAAALAGDFLLAEDDDSSVEKGRALLELAADAGHVDAITSLGNRLLNGIGMEADPDSGVAFLRRGMTLGSPRAHLHLGVAYLEGKGVKQHARAAYRCFEYAAEAGITDAVYYVAVCQEQGTGTDEDHSAAFENYQTAATRGHGYAQFQVGWHYLVGVGAEKSEPKAREWFAKAADQDVPDAIFQLGLDAQNRAEASGTSTDKSRYQQEAFDWYQKGAELGHSGCQVNFGYLYHYGNGVKQDYNKAGHWYHKAALQGSAIAQNNFGVLVMNGLGYKKNDRIAFSWLTKAVKNGSSLAMANLGTMYLEGRGTSKDREQAIYWFLQGADRGNKDCLEHLRELGINYKPLRSAGGAN